MTPCERCDAKSCAGCVTAIRRLLQGGAPCPLASEPGPRAVGHAQRPPGLRRSPANLSGDYLVGERGPETLALAGACDVMPRGMEAAS
jgi:hypothetical protein